MAQDDVVQVYPVCDERKLNKASGMKFSLGNICNWWR